MRPSPGALVRGALCVKVLEGRRACLALDGRGNLFSAATKRGVRRQPLPLPLPSPATGELHGQRRLLVPLRSGLPRRAPQGPPAGSRSLVGRRVTPPPACLSGVIIPGELHAENCVMTSYTSPTCPGSTFPVD